MPSTKYSIFSVLRESLRGHTGWAPTWRDAAPKPSYDVIIVGGGGHGLATAYYLAKRYGVTNVAVVEKGWIGSGNVGRNTTIVRSNYLLPGNIPFYETSMKLWEGLEQDLNYNAMVSQRGVLNLYHSDAQRDAYARRGNAMRLHGIDSELLDRDADGLRFSRLRMERGDSTRSNCGWRKSSGRRPGRRSCKAMAASVSTGYSGRRSATRKMVLS